MVNENRSTVARVGIEVLNLVAPGLGLLRVTGLRASIGFLAASTLIILALALIGLIAPRPSFPALVIITALVIVAILALWIIAIVRTWRASRFRTSATGWARWYGIVAVFLMVSLSANVAVRAFHTVYKPFYLPSDTMVPTMRANDRIFVDMRGGRHPARGDIVLFAMPTNTIYIKRVVALPGDRVAMRGGVPIVNGQPARETLLGTMIWDNQPARRFREVLPSEAGSHEVIDLGPSMFDDMPEQVVPADNLFVLGDNRDRSADSRVPRAEYGVGWLPIADLIGAPLFIYWSGDHASIGRKLNH